MMPRPDYEKFCQLFPRSGPDYLASSDTHSEFPYAYAKVCRAHTLIREQVAHGPDHFGVNVDVFPIDRVPASRLRFAWQRTMALAVRAVLLAKVVEPTPDRSTLTRTALHVATLSGSFARPFSPGPTRASRRCAATPTLIGSGSSWRAPVANPREPSLTSTHGPVRSHDCPDPPKTVGTASTKVRRLHDVAPGSGLLDCRRPLRRQATMISLLMRRVRQLRAAVRPRQPLVHGRTVRHPRSLHLASRDQTRGRTCVRGRLVVTVADQVMAVRLGTSQCSSLLERRRTGVRRFPVGYGGLAMLVPSAGRCSV